MNDRKWRRILPGLYRINDIEVDQIWHSGGTCKGNFMWHVIVNGQTVEYHAYLRDAKQRAIAINGEIA